MTTSTRTKTPADDPISVDAPWSLDADAVVDALRTSPSDGLDDGEVETRRSTFGPNEVAQSEGVSRWQLVVNQFLSPIVGVLVAAGVAALLAGEVVEAVAVLIAVLVNAVIGFATEFRAVKSVESLRELGRTTAVVIRSGSRTQVDAAELVPGDVVELEEGDVVPADVRILESANLQADEAPLTGESEPQAVSPEPVNADTPLADRTSMVFKGTRITIGSGRGVVTATGSDTQIGDIATLVDEADDTGDTPLERQLDRLGKALIVAVIVVGVVVAAVGIAVGQDVQTMIETAIALAVAAVPEGLPVVATLALARGVVRMSRRNALVKRLSSVETLGSARAVFTDKTGTLTEGDMQVRVLQLGEAVVEMDTVEADGAEDDVARALAVAALCGNASLGADGEDDVGDPMEIALQQAAVRAGLGTRPALLDTAPEVREVAFDRETKMMATLHRVDAEADLPLPTDGILVAVKGAPGAVVRACTTGPSGEHLDDDGRRMWLDRQRDLAGQGLRVLGLAAKTVDDEGASPYEDLQLLGMVGLIDPPRPATAQAVADCHRAGVQVVMVTGDQPATARAIARDVGLVHDDDAEVVRGADLPPSSEWSAADRDRLANTRVFARLEPRQKVDLVDLAQSRGHVVGMTGDGVNDAPALKRADIGIAMGMKGTQVARDAADIVLQDDAFETIVVAIREGRTIFANIRRFVVYLLSGNLGEILAVTLAAVGGFALPLLPLQILFINLVSDVFPAAALGLVPGDDSVLDSPPRDPDEPILDRRRWLTTGAWSVLIAAATLGTFAFALGPAGLDDAAAVTVSFLTFVAARLLHTFNMRQPTESVLNNPITRSPIVWGALAVSAGLTAIGIYVTPLADVLGVVVPDAGMWGLIAAGSGAVLVIGQLAIWLRR